MPENNNECVNGRPTNMRRDHPMSRTRSGFVLVAGLITLATATGCHRSNPTPPPTPETSPQLVKSQQLFEAGEIEAASSLVSRVLVGEPNNVAAVLLAASILVAKDEQDQAVTLLEETASRLPAQEVELLRQAATILVSQDRLAAASERLQRLVELRPQDPTFRRQAADVFNRRGFRFDANEHLRELARLAPLAPSELRSLLTPSGSYVAFPEIPDLASPQTVELPTVVNLIRGLFGMDRLRESLSLLERVMAAGQPDPAVVSLRGLLLLESQDYDELGRWYTAADESCQRYPEYWLAAGGLALHRQQPALAVRAFAEAVRREPCDQSAIHRMTQALEANGDVQFAAAFRERAEVLKGLDELTGDILRNPGVGPAAFEVVSRELTAVGQVFEAFSWDLLNRQRQGLLGGELLDDPEQRRRLLDETDSERLLALRLCGLSWDDYSRDFALLEAAPERVTNALPSVQAETPAFLNVAGTSRLEFQYENASPAVARHFLLHQALGAGIACLDIDLDGRIDLYAGQGAGNPPGVAGRLPNLLARNLGAVFANVTDLAGADDRGYSMAVTSGDWNQDGFPDIVIGNMGVNHLLINQGDGTFRRWVGDAMWREAKYTSGLAIADITGDRLPEIIEVNYTDDPRIFEPLRFAADGSPLRLPGPLQFDASIDRMFVSQGDGSMQGRVLESNGQPMQRYGMGLLVTDIDRDGHNEIFVGNDQTANSLWDGSEQQAGAVLHDVAVAKGVAYGKGGAPTACMGIAAADFDHNGYLDFHITNFDDEWSNQYMQSEQRVFTDLALPFGIDLVSSGMLGFGTQPLDYDNNSFVDLVIGNGHIEDFRENGSAFQMPTQVLAGTGSVFEAMSVEGDPGYWQRGHLSRSLVTLDWNHDGRMDFAVTDLQEPLALLENRTASLGHWLQIHLVGTTSERDAIGAVVTVDLQDRSLTAFFQTGDGYMGKNQSILHFGLGPSTSVDKISVEWPSGESQQWTKILADRRWLIVEGESEPFHLQRPSR